MFFRCFKPKFYHKSKSATNYMKIRLDTVKRKRIAMVNFLKMDIVDFLKNGHDYNAYIRAEVLLEELRILSCYDLIERFCDCISQNDSLLLKNRECPEECREAVSSLIYAAAWVPDVPELKDLRALLTRRFGNFMDSSVNHGLVEKTKLRRRPSRELKIQTVKDIAKEFSINWDPTALNQFLLRQTSPLQIEGKVETKPYDPNLERGKNIAGDYSEDESVISQSWRRDSFSKDALSSSSSSSSSSSGSLGRDSVKKNKMILPYGLISPPYTKQGARNSEKAPKEKEEKEKSNEQENSRLLGSQGSDNEASSARENQITSSLQRPQLLDYDEVVARLAALSRR